MVERTEHLSKNGSGQEPSLEERIQIALLKRIFGYAKQNLAFALLGGGLLCLVFREQVPAVNLCLWYLAVQLAYLYIYILEKSYRRTTITPDNYPFLLKKRIISNLMACAAWSSSSILIFPTESLFHQFFLLFALSTIVTVITVTYSSLPKLVIMNCLLVMMPITIRLFLLGGELRLILGISSLLWQGIILKSTMGIARLTYRSVQLDEQLGEKIKTIKHMADHDTLTGLPNRLFFENVFSIMKHRADRHQSVLSVIFLDLDGFKEINDYYGHHRGDEVLQEVAERLTAVLRESDVVARFGGDEFALLLDGIKDYAEAELVAQKIIADVNRPYRATGHRTAIGCSLGISFYPKDGKNLQELIMQADKHMYTAKQSGKNHYRSTLRSTLTGPVFSFPQTAVLGRAHEG